MPQKLLFADELAEALRRSRVYVYAMKASGFKMPGGTASLEEARTWLAQNPSFKCTAYNKKQKAKPAKKITNLPVDFSN